MKKSSCFYISYIFSFTSHIPLANTCTHINKMYSKCVNRKELIEEYDYNTKSYTYMSDEQSKFLILPVIIKCYY